MTTAGQKAIQKAVLRATAGNARDHTIFAMALGTGLRLGESGETSPRGRQPVVGFPNGLVSLHVALPRR